MASGDSLVVMVPLSNETPGTAFATLDLRNAHPVLDFDAAVNEEAVFSGVLPRNYSGLGITATVTWMASSATSGDVVWEALFERHEDEVTDLDADSFATAQAATGTAPLVNGSVQYTEVVFTNAQIDGLLVGESFRLKARRNAVAAGDTMLGDAELIRVELRET